MEPIFDNFALKLKILKFSFIIPVYNRPEELKELLDSFVNQDIDDTSFYEIIIVDDGSHEDLRPVIEQYSDRLPIHYLRKKNTGPGDSRNRAMEIAHGEYFIILDSDVLLPARYLSRLRRAEQKGMLTDMGGGADAAHPEFSDFQKAVDSVMTSYLTTGGIRGKKTNISRYVPRSFNMIVHRKVFEETGGFSNMHPGEDPEWVYRAWNKGFKSVFYPELFVYHKRRINLKKFFDQMKKFGMSRVILLDRFPQYGGAMYYFPLIYSAGLILALLLALAGRPFLLILYAVYWLMILIEFLLRTKSPKISLLALFLYQIQMGAYAYGFLNAFIKIRMRGKKPEDAFPQLFFKLKN